MSCIAKKMFKKSCLHFACCLAQPSKGFLSVNLDGFILTVSYLLGINFGLLYPLVFYKIFLCVVPIFFFLCLFSVVGLQGDS